MKPSLFSVSYAGSWGQTALDLPDFMSPRRWPRHTPSSRRMPKKSFVSFVIPPGSIQAAPCGVGDMAWTITGCWAACCLRPGGLSLWPAIAPNCVPPTQATSTPWPTSQPPICRPAARQHIISDLKQEGWKGSDRFPKNEQDYKSMGLF